MNSSSTKMLQIPWKMRGSNCKHRWNSSFQLQNAANSTNILQIPWKMWGSNSKNAANTIEMAPSSSKLLQIARKMDRKKNQTISGPFENQIFGYPFLTAKCCQAVTRSLTPSSRAKPRWLQDSSTSSMPPTAAKAKPRRQDKRRGKPLNFSFWRLLKCSIHTGKDGGQKDFVSLDDF